MCQAVCERKDVLYMRARERGENADREVLVLTRWRRGERGKGREGREEEEAERQRQVTAEKTKEREKKQRIDKKRACATEHINADSPNST